MIDPIATALGLQPEVIAIVCFAVGLFAVIATGIVVVFFGERWREEREEDEHDAVFKID